MYRKLFLLTFALLTVAPAFINPQVAKPEEEEEEEEEELQVESAYTSEDVSKARKRAFYELAFGAILFLGSRGVDLLERYIRHNHKKYGLVEFVITDAPLDDTLGIGPIERRNHLRPQAQELVEKAIFGEQPSENYWHTTNRHEIIDQLINGGTAWMDKPWNFKIPRNEVLRTVIRAGFASAKTSLGFFAAGILIKGLYDLWNTPKEGDPKAPSNECSESVSPE